METRAKDHPQIMQELAASTLEAIDRAIDDMRLLRDRAAVATNLLDTDRAAIEHTREEREILASLDIEQEYPDSNQPDIGTLIASEQELIDQLKSARAFERSLADFSSVLLSAHRQIETGADLPDPGSASFLAIKMAELRAREDERQRFARDVHDGPAQAFANGIIGLEFIERALKSDRTTVIEDSLAEIERIKRTMREGLTEIRRFIFDHRPTMLRDRGLTSTLLHYVQSYQSIFPMIVDIDVDEGIGRMDPDLELTAFRVVQESIQNVSKHARANRVDVRIRKTPDDGILITVEDDGRGFDPARVSAHAMGGHGLKGIEERTNLIGGTFKIESQRGVGTKISLRLPPAQVSTD
jgi:two-component system, NarL family, sensor histidine kinase DegS